MRCTTVKCTHLVLIIPIGLITAHRNKLFYSHNILNDIFLSNPSWNQSQRTNGFKYTYAVRMKHSKYKQSALK